MLLVLRPSGATSCGNIPTLSALTCKMRRMEPLNGKVWSRGQWNNSSPSPTGDRRAPFWDQPTPPLADWEKSSAGRVELIV